MVTLQLPFDSASEKPEYEQKKQKSCKGTRHGTECASGSAICRSQKFLACLLSRTCTNPEQHSGSYDTNYGIDELFDHLGDGGRHHRTKALEISPEHSHYGYDEQTRSKHFQRIDAERRLHDMF